MNEVDRLDDSAEPELSEATASATPTKPDQLPEKFWDGEANEIRVENLLKSYLELERKLGRSVALPSDDDNEGWSKLYDVVGRPESPEDYAIEAPHPLLSADPEVNRALHEAGLSQKQAQIVYDLAGRHLIPTLESAMSEIEATQEQGRLARHFGGEERWQNVSDQLQKWASKTLAPEVYETLSSSHDGVLAMYEMMRRKEPTLVSAGGPGPSAATEAELNAMVGDPRYWRDRDPEFIARVTEGYRRLYQS